MQEIEFKDIRVGDRIRSSLKDGDLDIHYELTVVKATPGSMTWRLHYGPGPYDYLTAPHGAHAFTLLERPKREIKVGDRVRRENPEGVTLEFVVHSCSGGYISPKYGADPDQRLPGVVYDGSTFEVVEP